nr:hypothetical protein CFP56_41349 [Quercus suber]
MLQWRIGRSLARLYKTEHPVLKGSGNIKTWIATIWLYIRIKRYGGAQLKCVTQAFPAMIIGGDILKSDIRNWIRRTIRRRTIVARRLTDHFAELEICDSTRLVTDCSGVRSVSSCNQFYLWTA